MAAKKTRSVGATTKPAAPAKTRPRSTSATRATTATSPTKTSASTRTSASSPALDEHTTASHYRALRKQHEGEAAQDYCEAIADLLAAGIEARVGRIAERFGLSHVTVSRVVRRLASEGLVDARAHTPLGLTVKGRALAREAKRRHDIVLAFLRSLGVDDATAHIDAEGIEHHVSPATLTALEKFTREARARKPV